MTLNRRQFLNLAGGTVATSLLSTTQSVHAGAKPAIKAIGFDAFTTFDPQSIFALTESLFPDRGAELSNLWRTRLFEYTWLRTLYGNYADFWQVAKDALEFAAQMLKLELTVQKREELMGAFLKLKAYPPYALFETYCTVDRHPMRPLRRHQETGLSTPFAAFNSHDSAGFRACTH
jgi:2-haloacid dehalogenase